MRCLCYFMYTISEFDTEIYLYVGEQLEVCRRDLTPRQMESLTAISKQWAGGLETVDDNGGGVQKR